MGNTVERGRGLAVPGTAHSGDHLDVRHDPHLSQK
jgi:hypothetical protein